MKFNENKFKKQAKNEIINCRPGDWNHALRVVKWVKKLSKKKKQLYSNCFSIYSRYWMERNNQSKKDFSL